MVGQTFTVICALLGIIGLIFLSLYSVGWLKKHIHGGGFGNSGNAIRVRECVGIAQDKQLMIITVGSKTMLIGVTVNSVNMICDLSEEDIAAYEADDAPSESGFIQSLKRALAERNAANADPGAENPESKKDGRNEKNDF